jgi:cytochrome b561
VVVLENWLFLLIFIGLLITTLPMFRDVIYHVLGIHGGLLFPTPENYFNNHLFFGFLLIGVSLIQVFIHASNKDKKILMHQPVRDFKAYAHSVFYLFFMSSREQAGGGEKYYGRQRMVYLAMIYGIGLISVSGLYLYFMGTFGSIGSVLNLTHVLIAGFIYIVLAYHVALIVRNHDWVAFKCSFFTGKLPLWYIKKKHKIWYREILESEKKFIRLNDLKNKPHSPKPLTQAIIQFAENENVLLPAELAEVIAGKFQEAYDEEDLKRLIKFYSA